MRRDAAPDSGRRPATRAERRSVAPSPVPGAAPQPLLRLRNLSKRYGEAVAVHPLDLEIAAGEFVAILGPSGCGKTTLLRMLGGFIQPSTGTVAIAGRDVTALPPERRATNMVFQGYGLFPHMSVSQNIGYGPRIARRPEAETAAAVEEMIRLVQLEPLRHRPVTALSGGQQQRVALARALIMRPKVLLLDEPFAALDLRLRRAMQEELRELHKAIGGTFVFVTHDQGEAMGLATEIVVMNRGRVAQQGSAEDIYLRPETHFVSTFVGEANVFPGTRQGGRVRLPNGQQVQSAGPDGAVSVGVRPEMVKLGPSAQHCDVRFAGRVVERTFLGQFITLRIALDDGRRITAHSHELRVAQGDAVACGWSAGDQWVVAADG